MMQTSNGEHLTEEARKEVFRTIVNAQDQQMDVAESRRMVAERFRLTTSQVMTIEREGMDNDWPPLSANPDETKPDLRQTPFSS